MQTTHHSTITSTISGHDIDLLRVDHELVRVEDIAHHLSRIRRFNGGTLVGYSVAAHALHVCDLVRQAGGTLGAQRAALHHDSHEYLIGDTITPVKTAINIIAPAAWRSLETIVQRQVLSALGLHATYVSHRSLIDRADLVALATEKRDLKPANAHAWACLDGITPDPTTDTLRRALMPDDYWAEEFAQRDFELREHMALLAGMPGMHALI